MKKGQKVGVGFAIAGGVFLILCMLVVAIIYTISFFSAAAEAGGTEEPQQKWDGQWEETSKGKGTLRHRAKIQNGEIEIYWINENNGVDSLYWSGSFTLPENPEDSFTITSQNDTSKTADAFLASSEESKTFTCTADSISYEASATGETWTVTLQQVSNDTREGLGVESITIFEESRSNPTASLEFEEIGADATLDVTIDGQQFDKSSVSFFTENQNIATVKISDEKDYSDDDLEITITAVGEGTASIYAKSADGAVKSNVIAVTVTIMTPEREIAEAQGVPEEMIQNVIVACEAIGMERDGIVIEAATHDGTAGLCSVEYGNYRFDVTVNADYTVSMILSGDVTFYENGEAVANVNDRMVPNEVKSTLKTQSEEIIKLCLKSPSSAEFPGWLESDEWIINRNGSEYQVSAWVDAQNSFGAMIRSNFTITYTWEDPDIGSPTPTSVIIDGEEMLE